MQINITEAATIAVNVNFIAAGSCCIDFVGYGGESLLRHLSTPGFIPGVFFLIATILDTILDSKNRSYPYKLCKIRDRSGDLSKRWYVEFYIYDVAKACLVRKVDYSINRYKTVKERYNAANHICRIIDKKLEDGGHFNSEAKYQQLKPKTTYSLKGAVEYAIKIKASEAAQRTKSDYNSYGRIFIDWLIASNYYSINVNEVPARIIFEFCDHLKIVRKVGNTTSNNYIKFLRLIFNFLVDREIIKESPVKVDKLKEVTKTHIPYSDADAAKIKEYLRWHDPQLYLFCSFIYYTFIRPTELRHLQIKHILKDKILIPAAININGKNIRVSKNGKSEYVVIPEGLEKLIQELKLREFDKDWFIFGSRMPISGPHQVSRNTFINNYRDHLKAIKMNGNGYTIYAWKHTGVIKLYLAIKDLKKVQRQCRHSDVRITDRYLRDLGLFDNEEVVNNFPAF
jgi:integrase